MQVVTQSENSKIKSMDFTELDTQAVLAGHTGEPTLGSIALNAWNTGQVLFNVHDTFGDDTELVFAKEAFIEFVDNLVRFRDAL